MGCGIPRLPVVLVIISMLLVGSAFGKNKNFRNEKKEVTYDGRSLMINGERQLLFSGSIHYPRSPPERNDANGVEPSLSYVIRIGGKPLKEKSDLHERQKEHESWLDIIRKAKAGGLNCIQTYVFWNIHEPVQGQFNFTGNYDLVKFIKLINDEGLFVTLRIGPYIEAEWNFGGFPYWMKEVPGIIFRSDNEPFKYHMQKFATTIVDMMKKEKLFAPQGGPIIMSQIENEYNNVQLAYREKGKSYIQWAANMAVALDTGVPWIMCKQKNAPAEVVNTCNGRHCGDTFTGPNGPDKPSLWTENWTAQYRVYGDPPSQRTAEDIAYAVARFFAKNGTLTNYYMYHGGTNFGRTSSSFVTTRYYDEAPLDEFALPREPKFGHLRDLHTALRLSKRALLWGIPSDKKISDELEIRTYEQPGTDVCAAFLTNNNTFSEKTIKFKNRKFVLPPRSISILPDCKTVVFNTQTIVAQHSSRNFLESEKAKNLKWEMHSEEVPKINDLKKRSKAPQELYALTKDRSDYAWYSSNLVIDQEDLPHRTDISPILQVANLGHAMVAFVNGEYIGSAHGSNIDKSFVFRKAITLKPGNNHITLLCSTVGFPNSGAYMEKRFAGPRAITIQGLSAGTLDVTLNNWGHDVGLKGERQQVYTEEGVKKLDWQPSKKEGPAVTWYKTYFDTPEGNDPVALRMNHMGKGMAWVNGKSIGRYWVNYLSPLGKPTQSEYHVPRAFLKPGKNLLVIFEEEMGVNPEEIEVVLVNRDTVCSFITGNHPPSVDSWEAKGGVFKPLVKDIKPGSKLNCPFGEVIEKVNFASFGNPNGFCGSYSTGTCNSPNSRIVVEKACLGKNSCSIPFDTNVFEDKCPGTPKALAIQVTCGLTPLEKVGVREIEE